MVTPDPEIKYLSTKDKLASSRLKEATEKEAKIALLTELRRIENQKQKAEKLKKAASPQEAYKLANRKKREAQEKQAKQEALLLAEQLRIFKRKEALRKKAKEKSIARKIKKKFDYYRNIHFF